ncbi:hypothetical protein GCM10027277_39630 [Pseudoduganella ginsengisoli]|uniref:DUF2796 domain-containing protein n=1 Tax=Pseudoduganella ginsengisoli TaxID=1462440 RepID=A0A6L6PWP9_9BURK|nr:hypothetical protein [Pseudoduganella ginsengisoli]MTW01967.1 hypothetical protein [Pseudoduganella ginsengisoli]
MKQSIAAVVLCMAGLTAGHAHEMESNRATLVLREGGHLSLTLYLDYAQALHQALAPSRPFEEFMLTHATMPAAQFQQALDGAHRKFEQATRAAVKAGQPLAFRGWQWPAAAQVQQKLRERAMTLVRMQGAHSHEAPLEVRAELAAGEDFHSLKMQFPAEFRDVLVVSYRPAQVWVKPDQPSPAVVF